MFFRSVLRRPPLLAAGLIAVVAFAGVATAAIPGPDGKVIVCYELPAGSGPLRPVESASDCTGGEASVALGTNGTQGPAGPAGPQGPPGPAGPTVTAEAPQVFERLVDGRLSGGRYSELPLDGSPLEFAVDVPAGTYVVLAQMEMTGFAVRAYPGAFGTTRYSIYDTEVDCTVSGGGQRNSARQAFQNGEVWTQNMTVTLDRPGQVVLACKIDKWERQDPRDSYAVWLRTVRLTATRLPQTRVTRTVTLAAIVAATPGTRESRPPSATSIERLEQNLAAQNLAAIGRRLENR